MQGTQGNRAIPPIETPDIRLNALFANCETRAEMANQAGISPFSGAEGMPAPYNCQYTF